MKKIIFTIVAVVMVMLSGCAEKSTVFDSPVCGEGAAPFSLEAIYWDYVCAHQKGGDV